MKYGKRVKLKANNDIVQDVDKSLKEDIEYYRFQAELAEKIYIRGLETEKDIISQAMQMQYVFSFIAAAVFMVAPLTCQYRGNVSLSYICMMYTIIAIPLLLCFVFAMLAQRRLLHLDFAGVEETLDYIGENKKHMVDTINRYRYVIEQYKILQSSISENNKKRVKKLMIAQIFFYIAIAFIVAAYVMFFC